MEHPITSVFLSVSWTDRTSDALFRNLQGSEAAGTLKNCRIAVKLPVPLTLQLKIAPAALTYLSHSNSQRHQEVNKFFFGESGIPFINFREKEAVPIVSFATSGIIVSDYESDIVCPVSKPL